MKILSTCRAADVMGGNALWNVGVGGLFCFFVILRKE